jgi:hypothetical protein
MCHCVDDWMSCNYMILIVRHLFIFRYNFVHAIVVCIDSYVSLVMYRRWIQLGSNWHTRPIYLSGYIR